MQAIIRRPVTIAMAMALGFATLSPASGGVPRRVVERSANVSARVISTRFIFKTEPGTNTQTPAITSGSGITQADWWLFAAQDDSTLVAVKGTDGALEAVRVFPSVDGSDRFSDVYGNKKLKPDLEAALTIPVASGFARGFGVEVSRNRPTVQAVLLVGSGSKAVLRDRMALIFPKDPVAESMAIPVQASALYEAMRREPALVGTEGELNIEGVSLVRGNSCLRFYNRGNGRKGSVVGSVDIRLDALLGYLVKASKDPKEPFTPRFERRVSYDLGLAEDGETIGITDAITIPPLPGAPRGMRGEIHAMSVVVEHTKSAVNDGYTSDAGIVLELPDGRLVMAPFRGIEGAGSLKVEGLSIVSARWVGRTPQLEINFVAVTDSDSKDIETPSTLAKVEVVFRP
ncbi:MAG: hypothetical protein IPF53_12335 [Blastocatellia bacterium]|nr:hypothetical protein [Blastocatellia bacterium]